MTDAVDDALEAASDAFKRTARSEIEAVKLEMRDVLRVMYSKAPTEAIRLDLPAPRLQLRWAADHRYDYSHTCYYELVFPLREHDCRNDDKQGACVVELSRTAVGLGGADNLARWSADDPWLSTPFRDGSHIQWDRQTFGGTLPMWTIYPDGSAHELKPRNAE